MLKMQLPLWPFTPSNSGKSQQWPQVLAVISAGFASIGVGLHMGWFAPAQLKFHKGEMTFPVTKQEAYYISLIAPLAFVIGCPLTALLADRLGRKLTILLLAIPLTVSWLLIATAQNVATLYVAKLIAGIAQGAAFSLMPMYIGEITEPKVRGCLGVSFSSSMIFGILLINIYGSYTTIQQSAYISLFAPILFLITFIGMPESPYYYLMKGKTNEARQSLQWLRMIKDVDKELTQLQMDVERQISEPGSIRDIFVIASNRKAFFTIAALRIFQPLSGLSTINNYSQMIFHEAGGDLSPETSSVLLVTCQLASLLLASSLMDKFGRKQLFIYSSILTAIWLIVESIYFYLKTSDVDVSALGWLPVAGFLLYITSLSFGIGSVPNVMTGELLSASVKAKALGILNIILAFSITISASSFQIFERLFGMYASFLCFALCCILGALYSIKYVPETKGKTLEQIQMCFKGKDKNEGVVT